MAEPLAIQSDVETALGRDLTSPEAIRVGPILSKASALFRLEAQQDFTAGRSKVRLKVNGGRVYLPQRPATEVHTVDDDSGSSVSFDQPEGGQWLIVTLGNHEFVTVDYSHGGGVPELVTATVAEIAAQVLSISPEAVTGVTKYDSNAGPFSESRTYAAWALGGRTSLSPDDKALARSFRVRVPTTWVQSLPTDSLRWPEVI